MRPDSNINVMKSNNSFQRWRHSHGYGVHSPFGYNVVTRAIRPGKYGWYGYSDIDLSMVHPDWHIRREARMLLRLVAMLKPGSAFIPNGTHPAYQAAVRAVSKKIVIRQHGHDADECDLICTRGDFLPLQTLIDTLSRPGGWVALKDAPEGWEEQLFDAMKEGIMFVGKSNILIIPHPGMEKIRYPMAL